MQNRLPLKVGLLSYLTFHIYDIFWLARIRSELMATTGIFVPDIRRLIWLAAFRVVSFVVGLAALLTIFNGSGGIGSGVVLLILFALEILSNRIYPQWLMPFVKAVSLATDGKINETAAMSLLLITPSIGVATIQQALVNPESMPSYLATMEVPRFEKLQQLDKNKPLKLTLTIIAVVMAVFLILLLALPYTIDLLY